MFKDASEGKGTAFNYFPLQPRLQSMATHYLEYREFSKNNNQNILLFYQFKNDPSDVPVLVFPDGCIEIIFCCNPNRPSASIYGSVLNSRSIHFEAGYEHFAVRLLPEQGRRFMNYPVSEITDKKLPLLELVLADSSIVENICEQTSFTDRIHVFMEFIQAVTREERAVPEFIDYSVKKIYTHKGNITIKELAEDTGYSDRYLRRKFEEFIGMKPKLFCQIVRVQNSLQTLMHRRDFHLMDVLDELGYYDQSHFIGEFKRFNMLPPSQLKKLLVNEAYDIGGIV